MTKTTVDGYVCEICGTIYQNKIYADYCEDGHNTVYVKFRREDLFKLYQFIFTKDDSLLTASLMNTLRKYSKGSYT